ncbi:energy-coupling factor ABC transporter ATP-binding protein [Curvivirga aplysinae]|uniref:energy-coupling factor ABC transporter ATP-binding protein n=1 Tax=Curvivirga aplysinae TaxID=2529852 RepID=UPI0012BB8CBE|nr:ABC transporter ATP-binding protein [Curvivirga aplysinae]MTI11231.1 ABC transporter ATP-binding protein [Curvivirga aplysinae]
MPSLINLKDVHFAYPSRPSVLNGVDLSLSAGERLCLTGSNGAGKSTLFQIIVGLLHPTQGDVFAFGQSRKVEKDFHEVRRLAGLVFQDPDDQLFCPTVAEDIAFGPMNLGKSKEEAMAIVDTVLQQINMTKLKDRITHKLSGGEKRLVTLAAVLAMGPEVLLLDEPTNAVDEAGTERLVEILNELPQAMIVISHDPHFRQKIATRSLRLQDGKLFDPTPKCDHAQTDMPEAIAV